MNLIGTLFKQGSPLLNKRQVWLRSTHCFSDAAIQDLHSRQFLANFLRSEKMHCLDGSVIVGEVKFKFLI